MIAAAPARHHQNPFAVGEIEKFLRLQLAFEANGIQPHVLHVGELILQALRIFAQQHVRRPAAAANQNLLAVDGEEALVVLIKLGVNFANTKL
jgi:hypothetical protein